MLYLFLFFFFFFFFYFFSISGRKGSRVDEGRRYLPLAAGVADVPGRAASMGVRRALVSARLALLVVRSSGGNGCESEDDGGDGLHFESVLESLKNEG